MKLASLIASGFKRFLPSPFTIAILITLFVVAVAMLNTHSAPEVDIKLASDIESPNGHVALVVDGADKYEWSNGESNDTIFIKNDFIVNPIELDLIASNSGNGYTSEYSVEYGSDGLFLQAKSNSNFKFLQLIKGWEKEMWNNNLLGFLVQMMLMLILGHVLALSKPIDRLISKFTSMCTNNATAAFLVTICTVAVALFNWGLGLIFGAIFARKVAEHAIKNGIKINYPLIGAAGYSGLMVWHGGISGSAPIKVSDDNAIHQLVQGSMSKEELAAIPAQIPFEQTVFSDMNLFVSACLLLALPLFMYYLGKRSDGELPQLTTIGRTEEENTKVEGAEKLDHSVMLAVGIGLLIILYTLFKMVDAQSSGFDLSFINPNFINLMLLGMCFMFHKTFYNFLNGVSEAIGGTSGILLQFPLYFGILGLMKVSGIMTDVSSFFISISNETTYPIYTFISAGIVNIFVPSGGGQWAVQGPIVIESAHNLGVPLNKSIMALSYGDQLTNMLQPFWALPLLAITQLKAKQILPYTLGLMMVGALIFILGLMLF